MTCNKIYLRDISERELLITLMDDPATAPDESDPRLEYFSWAFREAWKINLYVIRDKCQVRDREYIWSQPAVLSEWEPFSIDDSFYELARHVWCDSVGKYNREHVI